MSPLELRRHLKAWYKECERVDALRQYLTRSEEMAERRALFFIDTGQIPPPLVLPDYPEFPPECVGMICGAHGRRKGTPCQCNQIYRNGRCKWHGGLSTGPRTKEGKAKSAYNLKRASE